MVRTERTRKSAHGTGKTAYHARIPSSNTVGILNETKAYLSYRWHKKKNIGKNRAKCKQTEKNLFFCWKKVYWVHFDPRIFFPITGCRCLWFHFQFIHFTFFSFRIIFKHFPTTRTTSSTCRHIIFVIVKSLWSLEFSFVSNFFGYYCLAAMVFIVSAFSDGRFFSHRHTGTYIMMVSVATNRRKDELFVYFLFNKLKIHTKFNFLSGFITRQLILVDSFTLWW